MNADPEHNADFYEFDLKTVEEYRKKMLSAPIKDGKDVYKRQLTDIKNEVPDEDGIREIVDLWKNEDSGEIAPVW